MKLFQIIASAQNGRAFSNMSQALGYEDELLAKSTKYFIPVLTRALERQTQSAAGLQQVLEFFASRRFDRLLNDPRLFIHQNAKLEGERILDYLFGQETRIAKIVSNRAKVLAVPSNELRELFPVITVMIFGAVDIRTRRPMALILQRLTNGIADDRNAANPYLGVSQYLKNRERMENEPKRKRLFAFLTTANTPAFKPKMPEIATVARAKSVAAELSA